MKNVFLGLGLLLLASCGTTSIVTGTIVEDCSGVYVRNNNVDWKICNSSKIKPTDKEGNITINYIRVDKCKDSSICLVYHPSAQSIRIKKVLRK
ncbi:MAG: hypothetical protein KJ941_03995 [Bacteroidetes bacterium]|nr:hypothetical protein [Bacteroidota bacterium]